MADPLFAGQGTINFKNPHPLYGDTYTAGRDTVRAVAKKLRDEGHTVGYDGDGTWTVKKSPPKKK